jgi:uncharacterized protein YndB with AHSA1/START domain
MQASPNVAQRETRFVVERSFTAAPARVWEAWTQAAALGSWFGPEGIEIVDVEIDLRIGGHYRIVMQAGDGERQEVGGTYQEIAPLEKLVFTWAWHTTPERESLVTVALSPAGSGTSVSITHERFNDHAAAERHLQGWTSSLNKMATLLS